MGWQLEVKVPGTETGPPTEAKTTSVTTNFQTQQVLDMWRLTQRNRYWFTAARTQRKITYPTTRRGRMTRLTNFKGTENIEGDDHSIKILYVPCHVKSVMKEKVEYRGEVRKLS